MKSSLLLLAGFTLLAGLPARASADVGIALGPVLTEDAIGMRAGFDASLLVLAAERYVSDDEQRTRGELALRLPLSISRGVRLAPQVGLVPLDYRVTSAGARSMTLSASLTAAVTFKVAGPFWIALEPIRLERHVGTIELDEASGSLPTTDTTPAWTTSSWVALRLGW